MQALDLHLILDVNSNAALVAIERRKISTEGAVRPLHKGRPFAHSVATIRALDLYDVCAQIGEEAACKRPGCNLRKFENAKSRQWTSHFNLPALSRHDFGRSGDF